MLFQTIQFFAFFAVFFAAYVFLQRHRSWQNALIVLGSYIFYGAWDERFLVLIIASTAMDYVAGIGASGRNPSTKNLSLATGFLVIGSLIALWSTIGTSAQYLLPVLLLVLGIWGIAAIGQRLAEPARKKMYLIASLVLNLGLLATFKYMNFFADSFEQLMTGFGYQPSFVTLNIVLPVGISFYTFQTLSYSIDIYRGKIKPTENLLNFSAFVAFFPQLVAGPIERAANLLPQFAKDRNITRERLESGAVLFAWGLFKKVFIADNLAGIADGVFANPQAATSGELIVAVVAFTFQIFCDFSGYSDMARALARMLGFDLMLNFNIPYLARTPSEFWQRWHISLSSWLKDYLYIPLGGNRGSSLLTYRNLSLTMILGGLWHGASLTFILWGAFHGLILVIYRLAAVDDWLPRAGQKDFRAIAINTTAITVMFVLTMIGWLLFRANTMDTLNAYLHALGNGGWYKGWAALKDVLFYIWPLLLVQGIQTAKRKLEVFREMPAFVQLNMALFVLLCIVFLQPHEPAAFIYFEF